MGNLGDKKFYFIGKLFAKDLEKVKALGMNDVIEVVRVELEDIVMYWESGRDGVYNDRNKLCGDSIETKVSWISYADGEFTLSEEFCKRYSIEMCINGYNVELIFMLIEEDYIELEVDLDMWLGGRRTVYKRNFNVVKKSYGDVVCEYVAEVL